MKHAFKKRISIEVLDAEPTYYLEDHLFREAIISMVRDLPLIELSKIFKLEKIDPRTKESLRSLTDPETPEWKRHLISDLYDSKTVDFLVTLNTPEDGGD